MESFFIVRMAARYDDAKSGRGDVWRQFLQTAANVADDDFLGSGKALTAGVGFAIVQDPNVEIDLGRQSANRLSYMAAADDQQSNARQNRQVSDAVANCRFWPPLKGQQVFRDFFGWHAFAALARLLCRVQVWTGRESMA